MKILSVWFVAQGRSVSPFLKPAIGDGEYALHDVTRVVSAYWLAMAVPWAWGHQVNLYLFFVGEHVDEGVRIDMFWHWAADV